MKKSKAKNKKTLKEKGITLIALVVTVVILLILAGISLNMVLGENGIIKRSEDAASQTQYKQAEEEVILALSEWQIEQVDTNEKTFTQFMADTLGINESDIIDNGSTYTIKYKGYEFKVDATTFELANSETPNLDDPLFTYEILTTVQASNGNGTTKVANVASTDMNGLKLAETKNIAGTVAITGFNPENKIIQDLEENVPDNSCMGTGCLADLEIEIPECLSTLEIPAMVEIGGLNYTVTEIGDSAFGYDDNTSTSVSKWATEEVIIPGSVTSIGNCAFRTCTRLSSIDISSSVIGYEAFAYCENLRSVTIQEGVTSISHNAFYETPFLETQFSENGGMLIIGNILVCVSYYIETAYIPNNVTSISSYAFNSNNLSSVIIPGSVTSIGERAFNECNNLSSITIQNGMTSIGEYWFHNLSITSVDIPSSVTSIGDGAFADCQNLRSITIPSSVTSIGEWAFECTNLSSIDIPNSVTSIGEWAFSECRNLSSITIPSSVTSIDTNMVSDCRNLSSITIPSSVTSITGDFFMSGITDIYYKGTQAQWNNITFNYFYLGGITIHYNYSE